MHFLNWASQGASLLHQNECWGQNIPIQICLLWPQHPAPTVAKCHEGVSKAVEKKGKSVFHLFGRHSGFGDHPHQVSHSIAYILQTLEDAGMVINYPKSNLEPCQKVVHLGFLLDLKGGYSKYPQKS